ncbi:MAG: hypothetical protein KC486_28720, partial [Myxococcales bacterium]|nr:hypothetical protein [Myxococcales bacterium]
VLFLAYASAHSGSSRLQEGSEEDERLAVVDDSGEVNYERIGPNPMRLPEAGTVPEEAPEIPEEVPAEEPPVDEVPAELPEGVDAAGGPIDPAAEGSEAAEAAPAEGAAEGDAPAEPASDDAEAPAEGSDPA